MDNKEFVWTDDNVADALFQFAFKVFESADNCTPYYFMKKFKEQNPKSKQVESNKDWEIVSLYDRTDKTIITKEQDSKVEKAYLLRPEYWAIHSVKRLSTNEIFTVGDEVSNLDGDYYFGKTIQSFNIDNNKMYVIMNDYKGVFQLRDIQKKKPVLFVTEDGKSIYEETEKVWIVDGDLAIGEYKAIVAKSWYERWAGGYIFSTKEKAENYVLLNKTCLSLKEVISLSNWHSGMDKNEHREFCINTLKDYAIEKLNQK